MILAEHARTTGSALKNWFVAQCLDSLAVAALVVDWTADHWDSMGSRVGRAGGLLQFIPNFGGPLAVIVPAILGALSSDHYRFFYVLGLFAVIMAADGLLASTVHHEADGESPVLGVIDCADCARDDHSILGRVAGAAAAGDCVCFQEQAKTAGGGRFLEQDLFAKAYLHRGVGIPLTALLPRRHDPGHAGQRQRWE